MSRHKDAGLTLLVALLLIIAVFVQPAVPAHAAAEAQSAVQQPKVLLLYDSLAAGTPREGNVREVQRQLAAYHVQVTVAALDRYEQGMMTVFPSVITVINAPDLMLSQNKPYMEDLEQYNGQYLHIGYQPPARLEQALQLSTGLAEEESATLTAGAFRSEDLKLLQVPYITSSKAEREYGSLFLKSSGRVVPYAVSSGNFTYIPYLEEGNVSRLAAAAVLKDWLRAAPAAGPFLVIKEIYPFSDLALLEELAGRLYEAGIPFTASVRPVFSNTDFPAMQRYLKALKVVQAKNGSILVNAPALMPSINSSDHTLGGKMSGFINLLAENGVAPLGMGAEAFWTYDKEYAAAGMGYFDSVVLFPDENVIHMEETNVSASFASSLYSITPEFLQSLKHEGKAMPQLPMDAAVTVNLPEDEAGLSLLLQTLDDLWITFADYKQAGHTVATDTNTVSSADGVVKVNGSTLNIDYVPEIVSSDYQYKEEQFKSFKTLFSVQSKFFIVVITVALLLFGGLLTVGYRLYRKKYLK
ncbi:hypothetical protein PAECIP111892_03487 [Paenibacillus auburnensis]|uniref:DUF2334 domain-containing protein n=1 Tax=Paenibacillus auburnensis TaxID=2905649 RepID=A0ABN8GLQ2_9BACL|nr:hypothetical protein [Paenibacillus auburnensis]CAH1210416.1 hypothetical protein PAECIP111892_03487 [Paenibacillus auburnensis]